MKNNILVDNIILNNEVLSLNEQSINYIEATNKCIMNLFNCNIIDLEIVINDNSSLVINCFNTIDNSNTNLNIRVNNKSSFTLNHSFVNKGEYNLNIETSFLREESNITINIHGLNDGGKLLTNVNGYVHTNKFNNVLEENLRITNIHNGNVISNPNMYINTSKVIANHNTTIGGIRADELFYLMSKGLDKDNAVRLITKGFLIKIIEDNKMKIKINELFN